MVERPFFYTPLYIVLRSRDLPEVRHAFLAGDLDAEITELLASAGCPAHPTASARRSLLALTLLLRAAYPMTMIDRSNVEELVDRTHTFATQHNWEGLLT